VRKDAAEEEKCQEVADLLINGKTGKELESEIKEKIKRGPVSPLKKK
jgi:HMG box factor